MSQEKDRVQGTEAEPVSLIPGISDAEWLRGREAVRQWLLTLSNASKLTPEEKERVKQDSWNTITDVIIQGHKNVITEQLRETAAN